MGDPNVKILTQDKSEMQQFVRRLLKDVQALEYMIEHDWFETGVVRIGAEQEMCLVDDCFKPASLATEVMEQFGTDIPDWLATELARFNLEINLSPRLFTGTSLSEMEGELRERLQLIKTKTRAVDTQVVLTGILPTIRKFDLEDKNITPQERYFSLMTALRQMRGTDYELYLKGIDELSLRHPSALLEACNTSFQVHLQVEPSNFVQMYNIAQALTGPTLAISANSPLLLGKRLWHETRIVLFQQSIDDRKSKDYVRDKSPRVTFGKEWLQDSILEIYKDDIVRYRVMLGNSTTEDVFSAIKAGKTPKLKALQVHNGTVYRWNRPCFGINPDGRPHLRIENRVLPAGPTIIDEMANTAFWLGAMIGMADEYGDITQQMDFADARDNFIKGARTGMDSKFTWLNDKKVSAKELILEELIPLSRKGLEKHKLNKSDIDRYLSVIEKRAEKHATGARWMLRSYTGFLKEANKDEALTALTGLIHANQESEKPVHEWELPNLNDFQHYAPEKLLVEEFMMTDLFTVQSEDILELAADTMEWRKIRYLPVEDEEGKLVGLLSSWLLMRHFSKRTRLSDTEALTVGDIMHKAPITISPNQTVVEAVELMEKHKIGCLPVLSQGELVGMITEQNFLRLTNRLIKRSVAGRG
ncbi:MAG: CBS domain-containing protein [Bacteroidota bacterium]